jgi:hypothetical protein
MRDVLVIKGATPKLDRVEIARSFSFKLNLGNYQSADFFCSQKSECAAEDAEAASEALYAFCRKQVMKSVSDFQIEQARREAMQAQRRTA